MFQRIRVGRSTILVPSGVSRVPEGLWTHSACRPAAVAVSNLIGHLTRISLRPMRSGHTEWERPDAIEGWEAWIRHAGEVIGAAVERAVIVPPSSSHRQRFAMILLDGGLQQRGFAKWSLNPPNAVALAAEERLGSETHRTFLAPRLLDHGALDGWSYTINEPLPPGPHKPARFAPGQRSELISEIHRVLEGLTGPTTLHGDFAPWNVRRLSSDDVAVIDWEQVVAGPKPTDELWFVVTDALSKGNSVDDTVARVRVELSHHDNDQVAEAAMFLRQREHHEPPEADGSVQRSASLLEFESRISGVLRRIQS